MYRKVLFAILTILNLIVLSYAVTPLSSCQDIDTSGEYNLNQDLNTSELQCFDLYADNIEIDCQGHTISYFPAVKMVRTDNVTVKNCVFEGTGTEDGLIIRKSTNLNFINNTFINLDVAIPLDESNNNLIENNYFENTNVGISLVNSDNNIISGGEVLNNEAFYLYESQNNVFKGYEITLDNNPFLTLSYFDNNSKPQNNSFDLVFTNLKTPIVKLHTSDLISLNIFDELLFKTDISININPIAQANITLKDKNGDVRYSDVYTSNDLISIPSIIFGFAPYSDLGSNVYGLSNESLEPYTLIIDESNYLYYESIIDLNESIDVELLYSQNPIANATLFKDVIFENESNVIDGSTSYDNNYELFQHNLYDESGSLVDSNVNGLFNLDNLSIGIHTYTYNVANIHGVYSDNQTITFRVVSSDAPKINNIVINNAAPIFNNQNIDLTIDATSENAITSYSILNNNSVVLATNSVSNLVISPLNKGEHTLEIIVTNEFGISNYDYINLEVISTEKPVAQFVLPVLGYYEKDVVVSATNSYDNNNYSLSLYRFYDENDTLIEETSNTQTILQNYLMGDYTIKLSVVNEYGIESDVVVDTLSIVNATLPLIYNVTLSKNPLYEDESLVITINSSDLNNYSINKINVYLNNTLFASSNNSNEITLTNLSSGSYNFTITVENEYFVESLEVSKSIDVLVRPIITSLSSGGGGGSSKGGDLEENVIIVSENKIKRGTRESINKGDTLILQYKGLEAKFDVGTVTLSKLSISGFKSTSISYGQISTIDIDKDGKADIRLNYDGYKDGLATIYINEVVLNEIIRTSVEPIVEQVQNVVIPQVTTPQEPVVEDVSTALSGQVTASNGNMWLSIFVVLVLLAGFVYIFNKRRGDTPKKKTPHWQKNKKRPKDFGF